MKTDTAIVLITCENCQKANRVDLSRMSNHNPHCGLCKNPLKISKPIRLSDADFESVISSSALPLVVDFWAAWCAPCRMIAPVIDSLAGELEGKAIFAKLNVDENPKTSERFRVMSIPTLIIFSGGSESDRIIGFTSREAILARLNPYI